jgi:hypothetical protein
MPIKGVRNGTFLHFKNTKINSIKTAAKGAFKIIDNSRESWHH